MRDVSLTGNLSIADAFVVVQDQIEASIVTNQISIVAEVNFLDDLLNSSEDIQPFSGSTELGKLLSTRGPGTESPEPTTEGPVETTTSNNDVGTFSTETGPVGSTRNLANDVTTAGSSPYVSSTFDRPETSTREVDDLFSPNFTPEISQDISSKPSASPGTTTAQFNDDEASENIRSFPSTTGIPDESDISQDTSRTNTWILLTIVVLGALLVVAIIALARQCYTNVVKTPRRGGFKANNQINPEQPYVWTTKGASGWDWHF